MSRTIRRHAEWNSSLWLPPHHESIIPYIENNARGRATAKSILNKQEYYEAVSKRYTDKQHHIYKSVPGWFCRVYNKKERGESKRLVREFVVGINEDILITKAPGADWYWY